MIIEGFIGPSNTAAAITAAVGQSVNCYEEIADPGISKGPWLRKCPGVTPFSVLGAAGPQLFYQNGRCFSVAGNTFYEIFVDGSNVSHGTVATALNVIPTMCSNGTAGGELFITSGLNGYIFNLNTDTLTLIADIDFPQGEALMGEFMDGYFLVLIVDSRAFQISALFDGTSWDGLDIAERSEASDNLMGMRRSHREIWFLGNQTGEVWFDNGDPDFPFAPVQGVFLEQGTPAPFALQRIGNTVMWVSIDADGSGMVNLADGYTPKRVSTFAIEDMIQGIGVGSGAADVRAWTYQERGHWFYNIIIEPRDDTNPVFDLTTGRWGERGLAEPLTYVPNEVLVWHPNRPGSHCFAFGKHLVGDQLTGTVYEQSVDILGYDAADV